MCTACQPRRRYLLTDRLRFGDVILSRSKREWPRSLRDRLATCVIAMLGGGSYSHAALVVRGGLWYDSDDEGIGENSFPVGALAKVEKNGDRIRAYVDTRGYGAFAVYRHPEFRHPLNDSEEFDLLLRLLRNHGYQYPPLSRLASAATSLPPWLRTCIRPILPLVERVVWPGSHRPILPGPFCSELVTAFYEQVGLRLFVDARDPASVSPSDLARSRLRRVTDCFGFLDTSLPDAFPNKQAFCTEFCRVSPEGKVRDVADRVEAEAVSAELNRRLRDPDRMKVPGTLPDFLQGVWDQNSSDAVKPAGTVWTISEAAVEMGSDTFQPARILVDTALRPIYVFTIFGNRADFLQLTWDSEEAGRLDVSYTPYRQSSVRWTLVRRQ